MWWSIFPKTHKSFNIKWLSLSSTSPKFEIWSDKAHPRYSEPENLKYLKYLILSLSSLYLTKILKISNNPISSEQPHPTCISTYPQLQKPKKPFDPGFSILSGSIKERNIRIKSEGLELMTKCPELTLGSSCHSKMATASHHSSQVFELRQLNSEIPDSELVT